MQLRLFKRFFVGVMAASILSSCGAGSAAQKGWDKYAGSNKKNLEANLVLKYVYVEDEDANSVYYFGKYGNYSGARGQSTSFYFAYNVSQDYIYSIDSYAYSVADHISYAKKGTLINNS